MTRPNGSYKVPKILASKFPELFQNLKEEGKLEQFGIGEFEICAIYNLLNKNVLSTAILLFLGFSHGDSYPISSIEDVFKVLDVKHIAKVLKNLKAKRLVYVEKFEGDRDFYALDRHLLLSAINNLKHKKTNQTNFDKETANSLFDSLRLYPRIRKVSESLFKTGHYAQAIFEAFKCIEIMVKEKSENDNRDGQALMAYVFNESQPILKINQLRTTSERDEQVGFKFIFMGAMTGVRNPKAHDIIKQKDPYRTLEYLSLASLLAKRIDEAKRRYQE